MKKIKEFKDVSLTMSIVIWQAMKGKNNISNGVDVYQDDDGSIRIFPHKIPLIEARNLACDFLRNNDATYNDKVRYVHYNTSTVCIIFKNDREVKTGMAYLNPSDENNYNIFIGEALAYSRASGKKLPDDLAYFLDIKQ